jgi:hypothetical protein
MLDITQLLRVSYFGCGSTFFWSAKGNTHYLL